MAGGGATYIDCLSSIDMGWVNYYVHDLPETMKMGRKMFSEPQGINTLNTIRFVDDISEIDTIDIVYLGSVLQYLPDYTATLLSLIDKQPEYFFITDNFMGEYSTYATAQVNMPGRRIAYWIFQLEEIVLLFGNKGYRLVCKSTNFQPFHHFDNLSPEYRVKDTCNLLFERFDR